MILTPLMSKVIDKYRYFKIFMSFGAFLGGISFILEGPDDVLGYKHFWVTCVGDALLGISNAFLYIPIIP